MVGDMTETENAVGVVALADQSRAARRARQLAEATEVAHEAVAEARRLVALADEAVRLAARILLLSAQEAMEVHEAAEGEIVPQRGAERVCGATLGPGTKFARVCNEPIEYLTAAGAYANHGRQYSGWYHVHTGYDHNAVPDMFTTSGAKPLPY